MSDNPGNPGPPSRSHGAAAAALRHTAAVMADHLLHPALNATTTSGDDAILSNNGSSHVNAVEVVHGAYTPHQLVPQPLLRHATPMVILFSVAYITVFLLAVVNNFLVLTVIYRNPQLRTVTNYFLANLALADMTVSFIVLPITLLSNLFTEWHFGPFLCKAIPYLQAVAISASVSTLAAVAVERYLAIFCPQKKIITPQRAGMIILLLWLLPMAMQVPWALFQRQITFADNVTSITACVPTYPSKEFERSFFLGVVFLMLYLLPLCFLVVFYSMIGLKVWRRNVSGIRGSQTERNIQKQKIRIVRMLITVAVVFALAWLPIYAIRMRIYYGPPRGQWEKDIVNFFLIPIAQWMGSATSAVNPFIYCYFSEQFRKNIIDLLSSSSCCKRLACNSIGMQRVPTEAVKV